MAGDWPEAWLLTKRGGVESGTTKQKPIQCQGAGFELGTLGLQISTLITRTRFLHSTVEISLIANCVFTQIIHTCGTLDTGMIAQLLVAQENRHDTSTVQRAQEKRCLRNIAARQNCQYNLVNAMENNAVTYAQLLPDAVCFCRALSTSCWLCPYNSQSAYLSIVPYSSNKHTPSRQGRGRERIVFIETLHVSCTFCPSVIHRVTDSKSHTRVNFCHPILVTLLRLWYTYVRFVFICIETCPRDWLFFNNACYQVNLDKKNIQDATDSCLNNGAGILTLRSSEEETFLRGELEKDNLNNLFYWLGGVILLLLKGLLHGFLNYFDHRQNYL